MKFSLVNSLLSAFIVITIISAVTSLLIAHEATGQEVESKPESAAAKSEKVKAEQEKATHDEATHDEAANVETAKSPVGKKATDEKADIKKLHEMFRDRMTGSKMIGHFTLVGEETGQRQTEEYHILSAAKLDQEDQWSIVAKIKYGGKDFVTWPVTVQVKFAGDTPVIVVDDVTIPGMGTFNARVLFTKDQYAGTWSNESSGGHMFGKLGRLSPNEMKRRRRKKSDK